MEEDKHEKKLMFFDEQLRKEMHQISDTQIKSVSMYAVYIAATGVLVSRFDESTIWMPITLSLVSFLFSCIGMVSFSGAERRRKETLNSLYNIDRDLGMFEGYFPRRWEGAAQKTHMDFKVKECFELIKCKEFKKLMSIVLCQGWVFIVFALLGFISVSLYWIAWFVSILSVSPEAIV